MKNLLLLMIFGLALTTMTLDANAQCANGNCSSRNATLGESISQLPPPVIAAPAPQIAYSVMPGASAASSASSFAAPAQTGQLIVAGYTAPPPQQAQIAYYTVPAQFASFQAPSGASASSSAGSASTAASTSVSPALIGASTLAPGTACNGCGGSRFRPFQGLRARRGGNFSKSVSISRS